MRSLYWDKNKGHFIGTKIGILVGQKFWDILLGQKIPVGLAVRICGFHPQGSIDFLKLYRIHEQKMLRN